MRRRLTASTRARQSAGSQPESSDSWGGAARIIERRRRAAERPPPRRRRWRCGGNLFRLRGESVVRRERSRPRRSIVTRIGSLAVSLAAAISLAHGEARASIKVAGDGHDPVLRVDAGGYAEVNWTTSSGVRRSVLISPTGSVVYGGHLPGSDVSRPAPAALPYSVVVRRTPDGARWALQAWRRLARGPVELRFSRWRGAPTRLTLDTVCCRWGSENVRGSASFHGRPIYGQRSTHSGVPLDPFGRNVYLDSFRGREWTRMMGVLTHRPTGLFSLWIRGNWRGSRYRGAIIGPNWGWTLAPDAAAETASSLHRSGLPAGS